MEMLWCNIRNRQSKSKILKHEDDESANVTGLVYYV